VKGVAIQDTAMHVFADRPVISARRADEYLMSLYREHALAVSPGPAGVASISRPTHTQTQSVGVPST